MSVLPEYHGPFGKQQAERLLWRAGFGARAGEAEALTKLGMKHGVHALTRPAPYQLSGPAPVDEKGRPIAPADAVGHDHLFWLDRMVRTNAPMIEHMALIWHNWFATSNLGVASQQLMLNQSEMFRENALGKFSDLLTNVTQDPAMLVWLNGNQNVKQHPNENYGREMLELFTLGANRGAYTETDVRENARALTGWTGSVVNRQPSAFKFDPTRHDPGPETIFGKTGNYMWTDSCNLALTHPLHPSWFVTRLWGHFIPTTPDNATVQGLSNQYVKDDYKVLGVVESILMHPDFYNGPRMVKSPVVLNAGLLRMTNQYIANSIWWSLSAMSGQQLFYPPDVGGWDETRWLDTATFRGRWFIAALVQGAGTPTDTPNDPAQIVARSIQFWANPTISQTTETLLAQFAGAQIKRGAKLGDVETAVRRLVASSPDLQTA